MAVNVRLGKVVAALRFWYVKKNHCSVCAQTWAHMPDDQLRSMNAFSRADI